MNVRWKTSASILALLVHQQDRIIKGEKFKRINNWAEINSHIPKEKIGTSRDYRPRTKRITSEKPWLVKWIDHREDRNPHKAKTFSILIYPLISCHPFKAIRVGSEIKIIRTTTQTTLDRQKENSFSNTLHYQITIRRHKENQ